MASMLTKALADRLHHHHHQCSCCRKCSCSFIGIAIQQDGEQEQVSRQLSITRRPRSITHNSDRRRTNLFKNIYCHLLLLLLFVSNRIKLTISTSPSSSTSALNTTSPPLPRSRTDAFHHSPGPLEPATSEHNLIDNIISTLDVDNGELTTLELLNGGDFEEIEEKNTENGPTQREPELSPELVQFSPVPPTPTQLPPVYRMEMASALAPPLQIIATTSQQRRKRRRKLEERPVKDATVEMLMNTNYNPPPEFVHPILKRLTKFPASTFLPPRPQQDAMLTKNLEETNKQNDNAKQVEWSNKEKSVEIVFSTANALAISTSKLPNPGIQSPSNSVDVNATPQQQPSFSIASSSSGASSILTIESSYQKSSESQSTPIVGRFILVPPEPLIENLSADEDGDEPKSFITPASYVIESLEKLYKEFESNNLKALQQQGKPLPSFHTVKKRRLPRSVFVEVDETTDGAKRYKVEGDGEGNNHGGLVRRKRDYFGIPGGVTGYPYLYSGVDLTGYPYMYHGVGLAEYPYLYSGVDLAQYPQAGLTPFYSVIPPYQVQQQPAISVPVTPAANEQFSPGQSRVLTPTAQVPSMQQTGLPSAHLFNIPSSVSAAGERTNSMLQQQPMPSPPQSQPPRLFGSNPAPFRQQRPQTLWTPTATYGQISSLPNQRTDTMPSLQQQQNNPVTLARPLPSQSVPPTTNTQIPSYTDLESTQQTGNRVSPNYQRQLSLPSLLSRPPQSQFVGPFNYEQGRAHLPGSTVQQIGEQSDSMLQRRFGLKASLSQSPQSQPQHPLVGDSQASLQQQRPQTLWTPPTTYGQIPSLPNQRSDAMSTLQQEQNNPMTLSRPLPSQSVPPTPHNFQLQKQRPQDSLASTPTTNTQMPSYTDLGSTQQTGNRVSPSYQRQLSLPSSLSRPPQSQSVGPFNYEQGRAQMPLTSTSTSLNLPGSTFQQIGLQPDPMLQRRRLSAMTPLSPFQSAGPVPSNYQQEIQRQRMHMSATSTANAQGPSTQQTGSQLTPILQRRLSMLEPVSRPPQSQSVGPPPYNYASQPQTPGVAATIPANQWQRQMPRNQELSPLQQQLLKAPTYGNMRVGGGTENYNMPGIQTPSTRPLMSPGSDDGVFKAPLPVRYDTPRRRRPSSIVPVTSQQPVSPNMQSITAKQQWPYMPSQTMQSPYPPVSVPGGRFPYLSPQEQQYLYNQQQQNAYLNQQYYRLPEYTQYAPGLYPPSSVNPFLSPYAAGSQQAPINMFPPQRQGMPQVPYTQQPPGPYPMPPSFYPGRLPSPGMDRGGYSGGLVSSGQPSVRVPSSSPFMPQQQQRQLQPYQMQNRLFADPLSQGTLGGYGGPVRATGTISKGENPFAISPGYPSVGIPSLQQQAPFTAPSYYNSQLAPQQSHQQQARFGASPIGSGGGVQYNNANKQEQPVLAKLDGNRAETPYPLQTKAQSASYNPTGQFGGGGRGVNELKFSSKPNLQELPFSNRFGAGESGRESQASAAAEFNKIIQDVLAPTRTANNGAELARGGGTNDVNSAFNIPKSTSSSGQNPTVSQSGSRPEAEKSTGFDQRIPTNINSNPVETAQRFGNDKPQTAPNNINDSGGKAKSFEPFSPESFRAFSPPAFRTFSPENSAASSLNTPPSSPTPRENTVGGEGLLPKPSGSESRIGGLGGSERGRDVKESAGIGTGSFRSEFTLPIIDSPEALSELHKLQQLQHENSAKHATQQQQQQHEPSKEKLTDHHAQLGSNSRKSQAPSTQPTQTQQNAAPGSTKEGHAVPQHQQSGPGNREEPKSQSAPKQQQQLNQPGTSGNVGGGRGTGGGSATGSSQLTSQPSHGSGGEQRHQPIQWHNNPQSLSGNGQHAQSTQQKATENGGNGEQRNGPAQQLQPIQQQQQQQQHGGSGPDRAGTPFPHHQQILQQAHSRDSGLSETNSQSAVQQPGTTQERQLQFPGDGRGGNITTAGGHGGFGFGTGRPDNLQDSNHGGLHPSVRTGNSAPRGSTGDRDNYGRNSAAEIAPPLFRRPDTPQIPIQASPYKVQQEGIQRQATLDGRTTPQRNEPSFRQHMPHHGGDMPFYSQSQVDQYHQRMSDNPEKVANTQFENDNTILSWYLQRAKQKLRAGQASSPNPQHAEETPMGHQAPGLGPVGHSAGDRPSAIQPSHPSSAQLTLPNPHSAGATQAGGGTPSHHTAQAAIPSQKSSQSN